MEKSKYKTLSIPEPLHRKVEEVIEGTGFNSVSAFVAYILRQIVTENEGSATFSKEDEEKVKTRLRALGYIE